MPTSRPFLLSTAVLAWTGTAALAQLPSTQVAPGHADPYSHDPYITSSGATVPNPGVPQSGPTTPQERAIQRQNNKIDNSICKGC